MHLWSQPGHRHLRSTLEVQHEFCEAPVVDALLQAELTVLVTPPVEVKNLRSRYGCAGKKTIGTDA